MRCAPMWICWHCVCRTPPITTAVFSTNTPHTPGMLPSLLPGVYACGFDHIHCGYGKTTNIHLGRQPTFTGLGSTLWGVLWVWPHIQSYTATNIHLGRHWAFTGLGSALWGVFAGLAMVPNRGGRFSGKHGVKSTRGVSRVSSRAVGCGTHVGWEHMANRVWVCGVQGPCDSWLWSKEATSPWHFRAGW